MNPASMWVLRLGIGAFITWTLVASAERFCYVGLWSPLLWDLNCLRYGAMVASALGSWSPPLCEILAVFVIHMELWLSPLWDLSRLRYGVMVASVTWDLCRLSWSPLLRGTFVASAGRLRYVGPTPSLRRLCYVHLF